MWQIGIVVEDRDAATAALSEAFGVTWMLQERLIDIRHDDTDQTIELRLALSQQGPVHLEVLEAQEGTPWWPAHGLDHVAGWAADLGSTAARLEAAQFAREATYQGSDAPVGFSYHRAPSGFRAEHVDAARRDAMLSWIAGGDYPDIAGGGAAAHDAELAGTDTPPGYSPLSFDIGRPFHVGQVVTDLDAAMTELSEGLGLAWHSPQERTMPLRTDSGVAQVGVRFTYSKGDEPHIELLEGEAGSIWGPEHQGLHHIGVWATNFLDDAASLGQSGYPIEATLASRSTDGPTGFTYQTSLLGIRVELVPTAMKPAFQNWFAGGDFR